KSTTAISMKNWSSLTIKNLSFHYHDSEKDLHLSNISLAMRRGEKIAFIGESGSGKTTLLKIMRELYSPKKGSVELDGIVLKKGFKDISQHISLIPQDPEIFSTTIKENITLGLSYPKKTIMQYSDTACFTKVIPLLPKGLNSEINERGVNLSGGQKQRLALTRGLLASRDKELVLLDEPTSSVDATNERKIYANIFEIFKDKTVVSSIHRLHLLPMFDTIYLLEKGKIIAAGSFKDLQQNPSFKELWDKYKEESS
ncbi:MAG: ATP-binding cassette domain-containing protein, partial [Candidatus Woesearchaeota archaeon]